LYLSVISIGEIEMGVQKLTEQQKKVEISLWLHNKLPLWFADFAAMPLSYGEIGKYGE
jgi:predicted nucleic acid-binding protein